MVVRPLRHPALWPLGNKALAGGHSRQQRCEPSASEARFVVIDTETTGLSSRRDTIISLGLVAVESKKIIWESCWQQLVDPGRPVPPAVTALTGIDSTMLAGQPTLDEVLPEFLARLEPGVLVGYNVAFDLVFFHRSLKHYYRNQLPARYLDVRQLAGALFPPHLSSLDQLLERFGLAGRYRRHTALGDALATAEILLVLLPEAERRGLSNVSALQHYASRARDQWPPVALW